MVSSECVPFAKTGGLADVVNSLSKSLSSFGHDVRIIIPAYSSFSEHYKKSDLKTSVALGFSTEKVTFSLTTLENSRVKVYFVYHPFFTKRKGLYGNKESGTFRDNHRRFTLLNMSVFSLCSLLSWIPDIIHVHDWQASLIPAYLTSGSAGGDFSAVKSVLTIHNIGYQGIFSKHDIHVTGLDWEYTSNTKARYHDSLNFLRTGILNSDHVTTVSPTYAKQIQAPSHGEGLNTLLKEKKEHLSGILNGADYSEWNPESDPLLPLHYSRNDLLPKLSLKAMLQSECGLPIDPDKPLIGMVSRLAVQKGFHELCGTENHGDNRSGALKRICTDLDVQIVILGNGETQFEKALESLAGEYPQLKVFIIFDNTLAHLIEAGADFFLMPSIYEPCGLNQIYSLAYGTIPIVTNTGGLADTVIDETSHPGEGTGFLIDSPSSDAIFATVEKVISLWYHEKERVKEIRLRGMSKNFSWDISAKEYEKIYTDLTDERADPPE